MMFKKGIFAVTRKYFYWGIVAVIITLLVMTYISMINAYKEALTEIPMPLRESIYGYRFYGSPKCFAYQDPVTGRNYPGEIDLKRFTNETIAGCYVLNTTNEHNFALRLNKTNKLIMTPDFYWTESGKIIMPVFVRDNEKVYQDMLTIYYRRPI